jgi:tight adherence protein B
MRLGLLIAALATATAAGRPALEQGLRQACRRVLDLRRWRRERSLAAEQLAGVVAELAAHVRAGRSLAQAVDGCAADLPYPSAGRVRAAAEGIALGRPPSLALRSLGENEDVDLLLAAVALQARHGGDLADLLDRLSSLIAERRDQRRIAAVATAQARATASMVTLLPAAGIGFLWLIDRPSLVALLRSPIGWATLLCSCLLTALGWAAIRRMARVAA